jgi:uncharacterized protein YyaL (SSP411 family)
MAVLRAVLGGSAGLRRLLAALLLFLAGGAASAAPLVNQLKGNASPYLALHASDPVAWQEWGPEVVGRARRENKLIYLSIGYFSCHWCHVMQRESYRDADIAAYLNQHFIPVKIDRELEPALDARMIAFVEATRGRGGWPLNVFVTPEGHPLHATLYLPPDQFLGVLQRVAGLWQADSRSLAETARAEDNQVPPVTTLPVRPVAALAADVVTTALKLADPLQGGFGAQSKFPMVPQWEFLLRHYEHQPDERLKAMLLLALDQMAQHALQDHLGGGFFRYTVDPGWSQPHFEKMLYDNALLARLYRHAARVFGRADYAAIADRTLDFMQAELNSPGGGMIAALSAVDAGGVEGGYYLWPQAQLAALLSKDEYRAYALRYGVSGSPVFDAGFLPVPVLAATEVAATLQLSQVSVDALLANSLKKLSAARARRQAPRDTKVLAAWNGLALAAYAEAARGGGKKEYAVTARSVRTYIATRLWDGVDLRRAEVNGRTLGSVTLEDYAYVALGLLEWAEFSGQEEDFRFTRQVVERAWAVSYGARGWQQPQAGVILPGAGAAGMTGDGPTPSPAGVLAQVSQRLASKYRDRALQARALGALRGNGARLADDPFWHVTELAGLFFGG